MTIAIGVDIATANVRAIAFRLEPKPEIVAQVAQPLPAPFAVGPLGFEQEPVYQSAVNTAVGVLCSRLREVEREAVIGISVTATSGTVIAVDAAGSEMGPALMYNDRRGMELLTAFGVDFPDGRPTDTLGRVAWLKRQYPLAQVISSADFVNRFLVGSVVDADISHWVKAGIDLVEAKWPKATLRAIGVEESSLPNLTRPGHEIGMLTPALASSWRLPASVTVVAGMTDGCTSQIATGAVSAGDSVGILGTTLVIKAVSDSNVGMPQLGVYSHQGPDGNFWPGGASNIGASILSAVVPSREVAELRRFGDEAIQHGPASYLEYSLPTRGERFPFNAVSAEAFRVGQPDSPVDNFRALLESVAFVERLGLEVLEGNGVSLSRHFVSGGASRSGPWNSIRSTVLNQAVYQSPFADSGVGAAFLVFHAVLRESLGKILGDALPVAIVGEPDSASHSQLDDRYREFIGELVAREYLPSRWRDLR